MLPRFVLLEHRRDGVHWDFMLEAGASLRTWAFDAPIIPDIPMPARALPDHRAAYLDYEGPVSGDRGTVRRIDRGNYASITWTPDLIRVRLDGDQLRGIVELRRPAGAAEAVGPAAWAFLMRRKVD